MQNKNKFFLKKTAAFCLSAIMAFEALPIHSYAIGEDGGNSNKDDTPITDLVDLGSTMQYDSLTDEKESFVDESSQAAVVLEGNTLKYTFTLKKSTAKDNGDNLFRVKLPDPQVFEYVKAECASANVNFDKENNVVWGVIKQMPESTEIAINLDLKVLQEDALKKYDVGMEWVLNQDDPATKPYLNDELNWTKGSIIDVQFAKYDVQIPEGMSVVYNKIPTDPDAKPFFVFPDNGVKVVITTEVANLPLNTTAVLAAYERVDMRPEYITLNGKPVTKEEQLYPTFEGGLSKNTLEYNFPGFVPASQDQLSGFDVKISFDSLPRQKSTSLTGKTVIQKHYDVVDLSKPIDQYTKTEAKKDPTCKENGYQGYANGEGLEFFVVENKLEHVWNDKPEYQEIDGVMYEVIKCKNCDEVKKTVHTHDMKETARTEPTCTEKGSVTKECVCGKKVTEDIPATGHTFEKSKTIVPTCKDKGYTIYVCKKDGVEEKRDWVDALGHDYVENVVKPTCTLGGYTEHKCSRCGHSYTDNKTEMLGHTWGDWVITVKPSPTTDGSRFHKCERCGKIKTEVYKYSEHKHEYVNTVVAPTCDKDGYTRHDCKFCTESYQDTIVPAKGHTWGDWVVTLPPADKAEGVKERKCTDCGFVQTKIIPPKFHEHIYEVVKSVPATCEKDGYIDRVCKLCDEPKHEVLPALGHDMTEWKVVEEATEEKEGLKEQHCQRDGCNYKITEKIDKLPHTHTYIDKIVPPTCTEAGYTLHTCVKGDDTYKTDEVPALGHDWSEWVIVKDSTEDEVGQRKQTCSRCDAENVEEIPKKKHVHNYIETVVPPTCTEDGYTLHKCVKGDDEYKTDKTPALGHDLGDWVTVKEPTENETGLQEKKCSRCDYKETKILDKIHVHRYEDKVIAPTCTEKGYTLHTCKCGDSYKDTETAALGHDYGKWIVEKEATEETTGLEKRTCSRCDQFETREIPKLEHVHKYQETVVKATCTEDGYTLHECKCGHSYKDNIIKATGHEYEKTVKDATCEDDGKITYTCNKCNDTYTEKIEAKGHDWSDWKVTRKATEEKEGVETRTCARCDKEETRKIPKLTNPEDNKEKDPKLGYEGTAETAIWTTVTIISMLAMTAIVYITFKKKK